MKPVPLHGNLAAGRVALVDDEDYELVSQYRWNVYERRRASAPRIHGPYAHGRMIGDHTYAKVYMHRLLVAWPRVDHIDGNGLNNQRSNLRAATLGQNEANSGPRYGTSQFKGVSLDRRRWRAQITIDRRNYRLGYFATEEDAACAYD